MWGNLWVCRFPSSVARQKLWAYEFPSITSGTRTQHEISRLSWRLPWRGLGTEKSSVRQWFYSVVHTAFEPRWTLFSQWTVTMGSVHAKVRRMTPPTAALCVSHWPWPPCPGTRSGGLRTPPRLYSVYSHPWPWGKYPIREPRVKPECVTATFICWNDMQLDISEFNAVYCMIVLTPRLHVVIVGNKTILFSVISEFTEHLM